MRCACLLVPDLPLRAALRAHPDLAGHPLAIASSSDARAEVVAVSPEARRAGLYPPLSLTHARAVCPHLCVRVASPAAERTARATLLDVAFSCAPRAALAPPGAGLFASEAAVFADASGVRPLFGSEQNFASRLAARAERAGLPGIVVVASSRSIARLAARASTATPQSVRILSSDSQARFLDALAIDLLDTDDELARRLTRLGVRTLRDLLQLPRRALAQRLGPEILRLIALAQGTEIEAPLPRASQEHVEEAIDLEWPVDRLEPLFFVLRGLLSRLADRLAMRGLACGPLDLNLRLEGGGRDVRQVGVAAPTRDTRVLLRLVALSLEARPPEAPVASLAVRSHGQPFRRDQLDLFLPRGPDPMSLDQTLAELESLCGSGRVGAPVVADDHRPDAFSLEHFRPSPPRPSQAPAAAGLAVRALRPPVAAEVRVHCGHPEWIRSAVASGRVLRSAGPWRCTGRWWSEDARFAFDHFDIQVSDGSVLRLRFDWMQHTWQIDAIYD